MEELGAFAPKRQEVGKSVIVKSYVFVWHAESRVIGSLGTRALIHGQEKTGARVKGDAMSISKMLNHDSTQ